jgi:ATP-dependent RNA helicase DDX54/DBP10
LIYLLKTLVETGRLVLVFVSTKYHVEYLHFLCTAAELNCIGLFGDMDQEMRENTVETFRKGIKTTLIVTDLAARGIDIPLADYVIHFDFPATTKLFIHRSGRVARAGRDGTSYSIITPAEVPYLLDLELQLDRNFEFGYLSEEIVRTIHEDMRLIFYNVEEKARLEKSMKNGSKKYMKMRPPASKASVKRSKELKIGLHPRYADESQQKLSDFTEAIRNFRPTFNVLEFAAKNKRGHSSALDVKRLKPKLITEAETEAGDLELPQKRAAEERRSQGVCVTRDVGRSSPTRRKGQSLTKALASSTTPEVKGRQLSDN